MIELDFVKKGPLLFVGCHPDDVEYGCGGLISKLRNKVPIYVLTLSKNQKNPKNKNLIKENVQSLQILGIKNKDNILGDFTTREFSYQRQEICDFLWKIGKKINPSCVFIPPYDLHQDHQVGHDESLRVFRNKTIIAYDIPRSEKSSKSVIFVELSKKNLDDKLKALSKYKTYKNKNYFQKDVIVSECKANGVKVELSLCEVFNPISIVI
jgi:LmbE family N-acetylglucosaminyl deacetylase